MTEGKHVLAGPFATNAEAWRWIDRQMGQPISPREKVAQWLFDKSAGLLD